jgi:transcriptional regulator with XRE-family HTH domain
MAKPSPSHSGDPLLASIGRNIRAIRKEKAISQERLALLADLDRSYMGGLERGQHNLTVITLKRIAATLEVPIQRLFE